MTTKPPLSDGATPNWRRWPWTTHEATRSGQLEAMRNRRVSWLTKEPHRIIPKISENGRLYPVGLIEISRCVSITAIFCLYTCCFRGKKLELYTESVFFGRYWSVFLGIYHTDTKGKLGQYFRYQKIGGIPSKNLREPPFTQEWGASAPSLYTSPSFWRKKGIPAELFKKRVPAKS